VCAQDPRHLIHDRVGNGKPDCAGPRQIEHRNDSRRLQPTGSANGSFWSLRVMCCFDHLSE
jgi:hypothetical protein